MWPKCIPLILLASAHLSLAASLAKILVYTRTLNFRHDSIPTAVEALKARSSSIDVEIDNTEDQNMFNDETLSAYDAVLFLSTTGDGMLDDAGKTAFQKYLNLGGNFIGIHAASDTLNTTAFYGQELGAYFDYHPELQNATILVLDDSHPSTQKLPTEWPVQDEMYNFKSDPRDVGAVVVLTVNESTYTDDGTRQYDQGSPHPIAWYQEHGAGVQSGGTAGRSFYTALGHLNETWQDDTFMSHVLGGIQWTLLANTTKAFNDSAVVGNGVTVAAGNNSSTNSSQTSDGNEHDSALTVSVWPVWYCAMSMVVVSLYFQ
ncbi:class I glutamine amidotransferase-like protein [Hymenopellis radicata]|nr:class I glutamine amidotransferase-like protein [Hymenopellis radicata]